jgi:hypothetical protein
VAPRLRYVSWAESLSRPNVVVDGYANDATVVCLSHWPGVVVPEPWRHDLSTGIALAFVADGYPGLGADVEVVTNNHFDEDGAASVYALIAPDDALAHRPLLEAVAEVGDFATGTDPAALQVAFSLAALADPARSPLPSSVFDRPWADVTAAQYEHALALLPSLLAAPQSYRALWADEYDRYLAGVEVMAAASTDEHPAIDLSVVSLDAPVHDVALHNAVSGRVLAVVLDGSVEVRYRYESWVQAPTRRPRGRVDLAPLADRLSDAERDGARWGFDGVDSITPVLKVREGRSSIAAADVVGDVVAFLSSNQPAWDSLA